MRRLTLSMFALLVWTEALAVGITPLLPAYARRLSLSGVGASTLLASTSLALLLVAIPVGLVVDRIGARRMTLAAGGVLAASALAEAVPSTFWWLLTDRVVIGAAGGVFWTAGLAWLAGLPEGPRSPLGTGITMAGVGLVFGPGFIGVVAQLLGIGAPFLVIGAVMGALVLVLASAGHPARSVERQATSLSRVLAAAAARPQLRSALIGLTASAIAAGAMWVIVPLELHDAGESTGTIGVVLFVTGLGYIGASAVVARLGARIVTIGTSTLMGVALGIVMLPGSLSRSAAALIVTAALITPARGALATLCYELGARAAGGGIGTASIIGCLNSLWGAATVVAPLAAGAIFDAAGGPAAFASAQAAVLALAAVIAAGAGRFTLRSA